MAVSGVYNRGASVLDLPYMVGSSVTTSLVPVGGSGTVTGMIPYRMVIADTSATLTNVGQQSMTPVAYPTDGSFTAGQKVIGVSMDPVNPILTYPGAPGSTLLQDQPIPQGKGINVRHLGIAPLWTDNSTASTPIVQGDFVVASSVAGYGGCGAKGSLSTNALASSQHCIGRAVSAASANYQIVLVLIIPQEA